MFEDIGLDCTDGRKKKKARAPPPPTPTPSLDSEESDDVGKSAVSSPGGMKATYVNVIRKLDESSSRLKIEGPAEPIQCLNGVVSGNETSSQDSLGNHAKSASELKKLAVASGEGTPILKESTEINCREESSGRSLGAGLENDEKTSADADQKEEIGKEDGPESSLESTATAPQDNIIIQKEDVHHNSSTEVQTESVLPTGVINTVLQMDTVFEEIKVLSATEIVENGFEKEVIDEININMRISREEVVDMSIRRSMRKSTISDLSTDEMLTELTTADIIFSESVQPVRLPNSESGSVSSHASEQPGGVKSNSSLDEGVLLSVQRLEITSAHDINAPTLPETDELQLASTASSEHELVQKPAAELPSNASLLERKLENKAPSLHSLGHLLDFGETTKKIELG
jgi:hypothetical protein